MLPVQQLDHSILVPEEDRAVRRGGRTSHADRLPRQASFAKNSPGPSIATTASRPDFESTESFTLPFWTYKTCSHGSPWVKMTSLRRYSTIFLAMPAESRKACALNPLICFDFEAPFCVDFTARSPVGHRPRRSSSKRSGSTGLIRESFCAAINRGCQPSDATSLGRRSPAVASLAGHRVYLVKPRIPVRVFPALGRRQARHNPTFFTGLSSP